MGAQPAMVMLMFMCQGVENGFEDIFEREKQPGQSRDVVQQAETSRADEEIRPDEEHVPMEQEPHQSQHASVPGSSAIPPQPSSSSREEPMQVNTTPRRARIPEEDDDDMRIVRPRLEMSALISELCERDVLEIDSEKLAADNHSVYDIYTALKLDVGQVYYAPENKFERFWPFLLLIRRIRIKFRRRGNSFF